jgi:hypothetical protein
MIQQPTASRSACTMPTHAGAQYPSTVPAVRAVHGHRLLAGAKLRLGVPKSEAILYL